MVSDDDIESMLEPKAVFERVIERAKAGKRPDRLFTASEIMPFVRYAQFCENVMFGLANEVHDSQARAAEAMGTYDFQGNSGDQ